MDRKMRGREKREMKESVNTMSDGMMRYFWFFTQKYYINATIFFIWFCSLKVFLAMFSGYS